MAVSDPVSELAAPSPTAAAALRDDGRWTGPSSIARRGPDFGDYSTNAAMLLAPALGEPPRAIAERLGEALGGGWGRRSSAWRSPGRASSTCS